MTREDMWKEFENQLIRETRTPVTMSFNDAEKLTKLGIEETVAKWKRRLEQTRMEGVNLMTKNDLIEKYMKEIKELRNKEDADKYNGDYHPAYGDRIRMMNEFIKDLERVEE